MSKGHIPIRQCISCRTRRPAKHLLRFKRVENSIVLVKKGEWLPGRGCYVCKNESCLEKALRTKGFQRALRRSEVVPPPIEELLRRIEKEGKLYGHVDG